MQHYQNRAGYLLKQLNKPSLLGKRSTLNYMNLMKELQQTCNVLEQLRHLGLIQDTNEPWGITDLVLGQSSTS